MRKLTAALAALTVLALICPPVRAVGTRAASAILMDAESGRVLYEHDIHKPRLIASTTKLLTALVAVEQTDDLDQVVTIKGEWLGSEGSSIYLKTGRRSPCGGCCTVCCFSRAMTRPWPSPATRRRARRSSLS